MSGNKFKKPRPVQSSNVDTEISEKVNKILVDNSKTLLIQFIESGQLPKFLTSWSYYASTNDHSSFADTSVKLSKLLGLINVTSGVYKEPTEEDLSHQVTILGLRAQIVVIYKDILHNYSKVIYRALNNNKQSSTNPILRILTHIVNYDTFTANEFLNSFDLTLTILPKLLLPTKNELEDSNVLQVGKEHLSVRYNFIKFWIDLNSKVAYFHRKDLLTTNSKIMNNLWKHMIDGDTSTTLAMIIKFLDEKVLEESNFKRSTKCKILNENFMHKIQTLFNRIDKKSDENLYNLFIEFLEKLTCTSKYGLIFPNEKLWQINNNSGIIVKMNNSSFRINNNLIYTFLTTLKPWEAFNQMQLTMKLLQANPELIPIYMNWMVQHGGGYHDPSLTSWWVGHTLLYSNILQLPIPKSLLNNEFISVDANYSSKIISENITLAPISKSSLIKTLECDKYMLIQYAAQLIMFSLKKLKTVLESQLSVNKQEIVELVFANLPDTTKIVEGYCKILQKFPHRSDLKLLKLTLLSILREYETLNSANSTGSSAVVKLTNSGISEIIDNVETSSDYDLALLDCFFTILSVQDKEQELKWWNRSETSNSLFTSMIKLSTKQNIASAFSTKILLLLSNLTSSSLLFKESLLISPISALIHSFKNQNDDPNIWDLIDESIARAIRTPYKYVDLSHQKYNDVSVFVVVLFEQLRFVLKNSDVRITLRWFFNFLKLLIVGGESKPALLNLVQEYISDYPAEEFLPQLEFATTVLDTKGDSFATLMMETSNTDLLKSTAVDKKVLITKFDFAATILRLNLVVNDKSINNADSLIISLVSKLSNYILSSGENSLVSYCLTEEFWGKLFIQHSEISSGVVSSNRVLICELLNELFNLLPNDVTQSENEFAIFVDGTIDCALTLEIQTIVSNFVWILSDSQLRASIEKSNDNGVIHLKLAQSAISRHISVGLEFFHKLLAQSNNSIRDQIVSELIESNLINFKDADLKKEMDLILSTKSNHCFIKSFINSKLPRRDDILLYLIDSKIDDKYLICYIAYSIASVESQSNDQITEYIKRAADIVIELLTSNDKQLDWKQLLVVLSSGAQYVDENVKKSIISLLMEYIEMHGDKYSYIGEFAAIMNKMLDTSDSRVRTWIHKSMLYITKMYAESATLTSNFDYFLENMQQIIKETSKTESIWKLIPTAILNTQLEVFFGHKKWVQNEKYLRYTNSLIISGNPGAIQYEKLLQIFVNNESNVLATFPTVGNSKARFLSALIITSLFQFNPSKLSTSLLLDQLLVLYLGSIRAEDIIIKAILQKIENKLSKSWMVKVRNWELSEELNHEEFSLVGEPRLIVQDKSNFVISISKNFIKNSIKSGDNYLELPGRKQVNEDVIEEYESIYETSKLSMKQDYEHTVYDPEFFLLLVLNNEELIKIDKSSEDKSGIKFEIGQFISSGILQYIITNIGSANENVRSIVKIILNGLLQSLQTIENFKDANVYKVYISNILFTLTADNPIPNLVWYIYSLFSQILSNPGHFLYEKSFRYILSTPLIKSNDIPLFSSISLAMDNQIEEDSYYKQVVWFIEQLTVGTQTKSDLELVRNKGVIEWMMNLLNSPFITIQVKTLILQFVELIQSIDQGSDLLITRFGILSNLEQQYQQANNSLVDGQLKLNIEQLMVRFGISVGSSKRINTWTDGDLPKVIKRVCK